MSITSSICESSVCCHMHNNLLHDVQHFTAHDITARLAAAKEQCQARGVRFTPLRQQIYSLILQADKPVGAYDLITQLQQIRLAEPKNAEVADAKLNNTKPAKKNAPKNVAPPTVYRSLEFLLSENLIHQLTSINSYVPCCHPREQHTAAFLICEHCQRVQECSSVPVQEIMSFAEQDVGFVVARSVIELSGRCQDCQ